MGVIISSDYEYRFGNSFLLQENGDRLLLEDASGSLLINKNETDDQPLTHARIAHSRNWLPSSSISASSTAAGYFAAAPNNTLTYERWKPTSGAGPHTWQISSLSAVSLDYCCIAGHNLGSLGCTVTVEVYDGSAWAAVSAASLIADDSPIMFLFNETTSSKWRIKIEGGSPTIAVIKFGRSMQMPRPMFGGLAPMELSRNTVMKMNISESGEYLGYSKWRTYLETTYSWKNLTAAWVYEQWPTFQRAIETEPFFIAWRPDGYPAAAFGRATAPATPSTSGTKDFMDVQLTMRAISHD